MARSLVKVDRLISMTIIHLFSITLLVAHSTFAIGSIKIRIIGLIVIIDSHLLL